MLVVSVKLYQQSLHQDTWNKGAETKDGDSVRDLKRGEEKRPTTVKVVKEKKALWISEREPLTPQETIETKLPVRSAHIIQRSKKKTTKEVKVPSDPATLYKKVAKKVILRLCASFCFLICCRLDWGVRIVRDQASLQVRHFVICVIYISTEYGSSYQHAKMWNE